MCISIREGTALSKSTSNIEMLTFDLEQALATPLLTTNVVLYKRQLWAYNLGIHDCKTGKGCMHMWHKGIASQGSHEMGSCLLLHLRNMQSRATKLILYSNSCGGQKMKHKPSLLMDAHCCKFGLLHHTDRSKVYGQWPFLPPQ